MRKKQREGGTEFWERDLMLASSKPVASVMPLREDLFLKFLTPSASSAVVASLLVFLLTRMSFYSAPGILH